MKDRKQYMKEYREKNKEEIARKAKNRPLEQKAARLQYQKEYRKRNKEKVAKSEKEYYENNKERWAEYQKEYQKVYRKENRESINETQRKYQKNKRKTDPEFRLRCNLGGRLNRAIRAQGATKDSKAMDLTGCTWAELRSHLESQFTDGMTWDNYGKWHVDHIKPCILFDLLLDTEQKACFHYTNLQPLWAEDNLRKSDKYED